MTTEEYHSANIRLNRFKILLSVVILIIGIANLILQIIK